MQYCNMFMVSSGKFTTKMVKLHAPASCIHYRDEINVPSNTIIMQLKNLTIIIL